MIIFESIYKQFTHKGVTINALEDINLTINKGEIYGIVGESGAGKSTLIRCANLLEKPSKGNVIIEGKNLTQLPKYELLAARHKIGMIFQHFNLLSSRTVYQNIALPLELTKASKSEIKAKVESLLKLTGLVDKHSHYPAQLSGGQKQRVAIARALASDPSVLLSDEATSALDPETTESILTLLKEINQKLGLTILIITHEMNVVKQICDKVALIQNGRLIEQNSVGNFFTNPQTNLGKRFVAQSHQFAIPESIMMNMQNHYSDETPLPLIKLAFDDTRVSSPIISQLARQFDIDINVIQAKIENIQGCTLGLMLAELDGNEAQNAQAIEHLHSLQCQVEVVGYVKRSH